MKGSEWQDGVERVPLTATPRHSVATFNRIVSKNKKKEKGISSSERSGRCRRVSPALC